MYDNANFQEYFKVNMQKFLSGTNATPDLRIMMESMRKNVQALADAQRLALEGFQSITQRQSELLSDIMAHQTNMARDMMIEGTPEEKIARQAEMFGAIYQKSVSGMRELMDMVAQSQQDTTDLINRRVTATMTEIRNVMEKAADQRK